MIIPGIAMALYCYISYVLILKIKGIIEKKFFVTFNGNNVNNNNNNNRDQYRKMFFHTLIIIIDMFFYVCKCIFNTPTVEVEKNNNK